MENKISSLSVVSPKAVIGENVCIGPFSVIEDNVEIGDNTIIGANCMVGRYTKIGKNNHFFNNTSVGTLPQDLKFKNEVTYLEIGDNNTIREFVTINRACGEGETTKVGNGCFFMAYSHIAHNCVIGNGVIIANAGTLAGHIEVSDNVVIGGLVGVHQFVKIGKYAMIGGMSKIIKDVIPYALVDGNPTRIFGPNSIGLKRHGFTKEMIKTINGIYDIVFKTNYTKLEAIEEINKLYSDSDIAKTIVDFLNNSNRGIIR